MVNVWAADITPLLIEEIYRAYYNRVPKWRKEKADKLRNVADRARSVGAWILWEKIQEMTGLPEDAVFNLSHSGKYVLCACSDREGVQVGCDVEMTGALRMSVAERYFCPSECKIIRAGADAIIGHHPHVIQKEEYFKGKPIFYSLGNFVFDQRKPETSQSLIVQLNFTSIGYSIKLHPATINNCKPELQ